MSNTDEAYQDVAASITPVRTVDLSLIFYPDGLVLLQNDTEFCNGATMKRSQMDALVLLEFLNRQGFIKP